MLDYFYHLEPKDQFDLVKLIIDKVMIAALIGIAGLIAAIFLERLKLQLKKQEEYAKVALPPIIDMFNQSKINLDFGLSIIKKLDYEMKDFAEWAKNIHKNTYDIDNIKDIPYNPDAQQVINWKIRSRRFGEMPFADFLFYCCPNLILKDAVLKSNIMTDQDFFEPNKPFHNIFTMIRGRDNAPDGGLLYVIERNIVGDVFIQLTKTGRMSYFNKIDEFTFMLMASVPFTKRAQHKAIKNINFVISTMKDTIRMYPKGRLHGFDNTEKPITAEDALITSHVAILSQLRIISRNL